MSQYMMDVERVTAELHKQGYAFYSIGPWVQANKARVWKLYAKHNKIKILVGTGKNSKECLADAMSYLAAN
jgi:hypothetical protein